VDGGTSAVTAALITAIIAPTWMTFLQSRRNHRTLRNVDEAVNQKHLKPEGSPRLYDAVLSLHEWRDMADARFDRLDDAQAETVVRLQHLSQQLAQHIEECEAC
jgi:hypothetical protein